MASKNSTNLPLYLGFGVVKEKLKTDTFNLTKWISDGSLPAYFASDPRPIHLLIQEEPYNREYYLHETNIIKAAIKLSDLKEFQTAIGSTPKSEGILRCKPGTKWEEIKITLIEEDAVRINTPSGEGRFSYHQLGFSDKRKLNTPTVLWPLVKRFAENQGEVSAGNSSYSKNLQDTAKRLNKHLQDLFGIHESIYVGSYKKERAYRTRIFFSDKTITGK